MAKYKQGDFIILFKDIQIDKVMDVLEKKDGFEQQYELLKSGIVNESKIAGSSDMSFQQVENVRMERQETVRSSIELGMESEDVFVKLAAIGTITKICGKAPKALVRAAWFDNSDLIRKAAQKALTCCRGVEPLEKGELIKYLQSEKTEFRLKALELLSNGYDYSDVNVAAALDDVSAEVQLKAIDMLSLNQIVKESSRLSALLRDNDQFVKLAASRALAKIGRTDGKRELLSLLKSPKWYHRAQAVKSLGEIKDLNCLIDGLTCKYGDVRKSLISIIGSLADNRAVLPLVMIFRRNDPKDNGMILKNDLVDYVDDVNKLFRVLRKLDYIDSDNRLKSSSIVLSEANELVRNYGDKAASIIDVLEQSDYVRSVIPDAIAKIDKNNSLDYLLEFLNDTDVEIKKNVIEIIGTLHNKDPRSLKAVYDVLIKDNEDESVRWRAAWAVSLMGNNGIRCLENLIRKPDMEASLRELVIDTLHRMGYGNT